MNKRIVTTLVMSVIAISVHYTYAQFEMSVEAQERFIKEYGLDPDVAHAFFYHAQKSNSYKTLRGIRDEFLGIVGAEFKQGEQNPMYHAADSLMHQCFDRGLGDTKCFCIQHPDGTYSWQNLHPETPGIGSSYLCSHLYLPDFPGMMHANTPLKNIFKNMPPELAESIQNDLSNIPIIDKANLKKTLSFPLHNEDGTSVIVPTTFGDLRRAGCDIYEEREYQFNRALEILAYATNRIEQWMMAGKVAPTIERMKQDDFLRKLTGRDILRNTPGSSSGTRKRRKTTSRHPRKRRATLPQQRNTVKDVTSTEKDEVVEINNTDAARTLVALHHSNGLRN